MFSIPNFLSFLRIPLALLFLQENPAYRAVAIGLALMTDGLDGYYARKYCQISKLGTFLDPITDKLFVVVAVVIFFAEQRLAGWQVMALFGRDFALLVFSSYLWLSGNLGRYQVRAFLCGKISTVMQLITLLALTFQIAIPALWYALFILLAGLALLELYCKRHQNLKV